jgi:hypothetical protein
MTRNKLEKELIIEINKLVKQYGFEFKSEIKSSSNHYYFFEKNEKDYKYIQYLRFKKPNFISCDSEIKIFNKNVTELIKKIKSDCVFYTYTNGGVENFESDEYSLFSIEMDKFIHPKNSKSSIEGFEWNRMLSESIYVNEGKVDVLKKAKEIVEAFFTPLIHLIIPKIDTLNKIDNILNNFNELEVKNTEPPALSICFPLSQQYLMGLLIAHITNRSDKDFITEKYKELAENYGEDSFGYIDMIFKTIDYFKVEN